MSETSIKKRWLRRYLDAVHTGMELAMEMVELEGRYILPSKQIDGMPHGSGGDSDLSSFAASYDLLYQEIKEEYQRCIDTQREVKNAIEAMDNETEKTLLRYRYILGHKWERIAVNMGYTWRRVMQIHGNALYHFKIPE